MSADEDTELRDLVAQTLETNGVLGKIRAQLRASVFLALEEQESVKNKQPFLNQELKKYLNTKEGRNVTGLVKEFLQFFNLDFTLCVFESETGLGDQFEGRSHLASDLDILETSESAKLPLVAEVTKRYCNAGSNDIHHSQVTDLSPAQMKEARQKFDLYDKDYNGVIDKDELRNLFHDMFPSFHKNMLERYVTDEFKAVDRDFSQTIDFDEFLLMYKRLFILCKSVVSKDVVDLTSSFGRSSGSTTPTGGSSKIPFLKKPASTNTVVENRNKKNESSIPTFSDRGKNSAVSPRDEHSIDDDSFFDEPIPKEKPGFSRQKTPSPTIPKENGGMSSLSGLPSLNNNKEPVADASPPLTPNMEKDIKDIDKKMTDLGFEVPDDSYDEDFESSNLTPFGQTPRSARTDTNVKSIDEDIEEDIDEEISVADDLLKSVSSGIDDLTTDRTVSPTEQSIAFDYVEDILP